LGSLYASLQLFALEYSGVGPVGWELQVARLAAPVVAAYTAARALMLLFEERVQLLRLRFGRDHAIVAGLGEMGIALTRSLRYRGIPVVAIECDAGNPAIEPARQMGAVVIIGDARDPEMLRKARVEQARHLIAVCGDGVNADIAIRAAGLVGEDDGRVLECRVHIVDPALCQVLMAHELARERSGRCRIEYFNIFESGARSLLAEYPPFSRFVDRPSRLIVVGVGDLGRRVILQAVHEWRAAFGSDTGRLTVTIVDPQATQVAADLAAQYPALERAFDLDPVDVAIDPSSWRSGRMATTVWDSGGLGAVYVCSQIDGDSFAAGLFIGSQLASSGVPVVVCLAHRRGLGSLFDGSRNTHLRNLHTFGLLDQTCDYDLLFAGAYESIARAQHAGYVAAERERATGSAGNPSVVPWHELPEVLKESNRDQAAHIGTKLASIGCEIRPSGDWDSRLFEFTAAEIEVLARLEHDRWVEERFRMGWKLGSEKNVDKRITPYLVSWEELAEAIREHDRIVVRAIPAFLAKVGFQIVRHERVGSVRV
jgi:voltage-gated potassium channel Kch